MVKRPAKRRAWVAGDIRRLKALALKTSVAKIARTLKRTDNAIRQKAFSLGLSLETRPGSLTKKTGERQVGNFAPVVTNATSVR
jgi:hypothetical protein